MASLFSRIVSGDLPGELVFCEERWAALLDIKPSAPGHVLLLPRTEIQYLADLPPELLGELGGYLARTITAVKRATGAPAVNVVVNDGPPAGQMIPHAHLHVIPRAPQDGRHPFGSHVTYGDGELRRWGERLRTAWSGT